MSLVLPESKPQRLYREVCQMLSHANPLQSEWDFVGYDSWSASINTPLIEVGGGGSIGALKIQKKGQAEQNTFRTVTADLCGGLTPVPFNFGFPLPEVPSTGIIFKLPAFVEMDISENSFRAGFFSFTQAAQCGPSGALTFLLFLPRFFPNMNPYAPGFILHAGVLIVAAGISGAMVPDIGVTCSMGCAL